MSDRRLGKTHWQGMHALQLPRQVQSVGPDQELSYIMLSTPCPRFAVVRTSRIHFPRRSACRESHGANAETCLAHARASGLEPGGPALRTAAPRAHRTLALLRHWRRAIARGPDAAARE